MYSTTLGRSLAEFAETAPDKHAQEKLVHCLLDWSGVAIAGSLEPSARRISSYVRSSHGGDAASLAGGGRASLAGCVLANAVSGHALDFDDTHLGYWGHPSAVVMPVALALSETHPYSGVSLLTAVATGMEACCRIGLKLGETHRRAGWHITATAGIFGAAATAAAISGLDAERWPHALALCAVQAAGLTASFATDAKPFQVGRAAQLGLESCMLAAAGIDAPLDVIERSGGMAGAYSLDLQQARPTEIFDALDVSFKFVPACFGVQAAVVAAQEAAARRFPREPIPESVTVEIADGFLSMCTLERPQTLTEARFSLSFLVALALAGHDLASAWSISSEMLGCPNVRAIASRVIVKGNASLSASETLLHLVWKQDQVPERISLDLRASSGAAMMTERERLTEKFHQNCDSVIGKANALRLRDSILSVGGLKDASEISILLGSDTLPQ